MNLRRNFSSIVILLFACLLIAIPGNSQDNVRVTVSATSVNSLAANGTPASGLPAIGTPLMTLTKPDFSLQESGKPRTITTFVGPDAKPAAPSQLQPNEFSNQPDFRETSGAIFVVFDTIHTRYIDERDARIEVLKFLGKAAQAKHAVTLGILSDKGLRLYHDYRTGSDVLLAALAKAGLGGMKGIAAPAGLSDAEVNAEAARLTAFSKGEESNPAPQTQALRSNIDLPLVMFQDIAFAAEGLPGRKSLVWVTNAVPFDIDPKTMQFKSPQVISHGVAVNGVAVGGSKDALTDAEKKQIAPIWRRSMRALFDAGVGVYPVEVRGSFSAGSDAFTITRMKELALLTGGKAFYGSNDPFPEILAASNGNTAGYVLGFAAEANSNPDLRRIEVTANQQNIQVNHPAGFFPYEGTPKSQAAQEIGLAMGSPLEYTGIRFKVAVAGMEEGTGGKKKVNLVITLPGDSGILNEAAGTVDVGFVARAFNALGQAVGTMNEGASGKFPPDAVAQIKEMGFQLKRSFDVSPGECTVRFLTRDNQTGHMGDIIFPLNVK
jgi:VWFA-related protein